MRYPFNIFFIITLLLLPQGIYSASDVFHTGEKDDYVPVYYTTENGLPQNTPTAIAQTGDGYMWIATYGGLARFDGLKFKTFTTNSTPEIVTNRLTALHRDYLDTLWIGSETGDIMSYQAGRFQIVWENPRKDMSGRILCLYLDRKNILWIGTETGLRSYNTETKEFKNYDYALLVKHPEEVKEEFTVHSFAEDNEKNLWMASNRGVIRYKDGKFTNFDKADGIPEDNIIGLKTSPTGETWILTAKGFGKYHNGEYTSVLDIKSDDASLPMISDNDFCLFFNVAEVLYEFRDSKMVSHDISKLIATDVSSIFFDTEGNLWLGTNDGLVLLKKRFVHIYGYVRSENWSPTQAVIEDLNGAVWTTSTSKIIRWENGNFELFPIDSQYTDKPLSALAVDKNNDLWVGISGRGILKSENGKFVKFSDPNLASENINALFIDKTGALWIGTGNNGLQKYFNGEFQSYTIKEGLGSNTVSYITQDSQGTIWVGTFGGLSKIINDRIINVYPENQNSLSFVREIYEDGDGVYWIGTYGNGLFRLKDGVFKQITSNNGLAENIVSRILTDDDDNFWILGNQGIYTVSRKSLNSFADGEITRIFCTVYDRKDGMETDEGNGGRQPSGWKTKDGKLWFSMISGAVVIDPTQANYAPPPVYIEEALLEQKPLPPAEQIEVLPGQRNLSINYTAINFTKPEQVQFKYKLEGFDEDWQYVGARRTAFYSYLPPGNYKFVVAAFVGGEWSRQNAAIEIKVLAPYWHKWWFWSFILLGFLGIIVIFYQRRLVKLQKSRVRQQEFSRRVINAHESERQRIAVELHDGLGQALLVIKNWALLGLKEKPHNERVEKFLNEISETAAAAIDETRAIAHNLRPQHLQRLGLKAALESMIASVGESAAISFETYIEEIDDLLSEEGEIHVFRIVQECLNNIVKHSGTDSAVIEIYRQGKTFNISIKDFGKGFNVKQHQSPQNPNIDFGMNNIVQKVELLNGKFSIDSQLGEGTKIFISLNLP